MLSAFASYAAPNSLVWQARPECRIAAIATAAFNKPGFTRISSLSAGINFTNFLNAERHLTNQIFLNGSGVAVGDIDGDGLCDLFFCSLENSSRLYRNMGDWKFQDVSGRSGVNLSFTTGAAFADLDGDGDLDLIANTMARGTHVFFNKGDGAFSQHPLPLNSGKAGMSLALGDYDGDGWLDFYIANYRSSALTDMPNTQFRLKRIGGKTVVTSVNGRPASEPEFLNRFIVNEGGAIEELGESDVLYRNNGGTNFLPVSFIGGAFLGEDGMPLKEPPFDWGLSVMFRDINGDGLPDLYVCNDFSSPDRVWMNAGQGRFRAIDRSALRRTSLFSMGVDFADINRDGYQDIFVVDMLGREHYRRMTQTPDRSATHDSQRGRPDRPQYMMNTLFLNRGDGTFAEVAQLAGLEATDWSWTPMFLDVDLDGWEDLLVTNGHERDARNMDVIAQLARMKSEANVSPREALLNRKLFPRLANANFAFRNRGDLTFEDVSTRWGFSDRAVSQAMAAADLDNDGDLDLVVMHLNEPPGLYRNEGGAARVAIRLKGRGGNTRGIGSKITVRGGPIVQSQEVIAGGRYLASDDPIRVFAAGSVSNRLRIHVRWRSGRISELTDVPANTYCEIEEPSEMATRRDSIGPVPKPLFEDASNRLGHRHEDVAFDDFARQPLLPNKLSEPGPALAWQDVNEDGWDDLIITGGTGANPRVFLNDNGSFRPLNDRTFDAGITQEQMAVLAFPNGSDATVLVTTSNYENGDTSKIQKYRFPNLSRREAIALPDCNPGPIASGDVDGDGDLDLFVGSGCIPGRYPYPGRSYLLLNTNHQFLPSAHEMVFRDVGLVSGALFTDMDGDGDPDLALACEWGPVRLFINDAGQFQEGTKSWGLSPYMGWWNGIASGDFDGDGRLDLVVSNWGRNTRYESRRSRPLQLLYGDLDGDGVEDLVETWFDAERGDYVPSRTLDFLGKSMRLLRDRFATHSAYAKLNLAQLFPNQTRKLEANWLDTTVFLNRGGHFEARSLPIEAQFAPAFGICVGDFHGDGFEDIFLAQNFFATSPDTPRYDGGVGLLLKGDGKGNFDAVPPSTSGLKIFGEQRGCATADSNLDGRLDLAVGQNQEETKLYTNIGARPGLRIRLKGTPDNPHAIGASLRLKNSEKAGPLREIQAGAGYRSVNSAVQVMALGSSETVWVRWPGGKTTETVISSNSRELVISSPASN